MVLGPYELTKNHDSKPPPVGWVTHNESQKLKNGISYFYVVGYKITCDIIFFEKNIFLLPGIAIKISVM